MSDKAEAEADLKAAILAQVTVEGCHYCGDPVPADDGVRWCGRCVRSLWGPIHFPVLLQHGVLEELGELGEVFRE